MNEATTTSMGVYVRLLGYVKPYSLLFVMSVVGFAIYSSTQPMLAKMLEYFIDGLQGTAYDMSSVLTPDGNLTGFLQGLPFVGDRFNNPAAVEIAYLVPLMIVGIYIFRGIGYFLGNYLLARVSFSLIHDLRTELFEHMLYLPNSYFDSNSAGRMLAKVTYNVNEVTEAATRATKILIREGTSVIALLSYLIWQNWKLTLVFLIITPFIGVLVGVSGKHIKKYSKRAQNAIGDVTHVSREVISGMNIVRSFGGEAYEKRRFAGSSESNRKQNLKLVRTSELYTSIMQLVIAVAMALMMYLALNMLGDASPGELVAYVTAAGMLPKSLRQLSEVNAMIQKGVAAAESVFEVTDATPEPDQGQHVAQRVEGKIDIEGLTFNYPGHDEAVLKDINLSIAPGEMIAFVGHSGSGKSTLISLLTRFYNHLQGKILLDGIDVEDYKLMNLREHIALVNQNVVLFNDTVANNIAYGRLQGAPADKLEAAIETAYLSDFVNSLPEGVNTFIGEDGGRLSGGQRQRLAMARAILKDAPVLILDEATSALDTESERYIQAALEKVMDGRTTLVIAHRLSTIEKADRIVVMDKGRIVETGTHIQLLEKGGAYKNLYDMQFSE